MRSATTRRHFFRDCGVGVGKIALASLLSDAVSTGAFAPPTGAVNPLAPRRRTSPPKAKRVIHLFMAGAPSQLDLFDYKPELAQARRQAAPAVGHRRPALRLHPARRGRARAAVQVRQARPVRRGALRDAAAPREGRGRHLPSSSRSTPTSSTTPRRRSSSTPASPSRAGRASARGSSTASAPRRRTCPRSSSCPPAAGISGGAANWSSGFLPTVYTGVRFRNQGDPILNVSSPPGVDAQAPARLARPGRRAEPAAARRRRATRRSPRASPPTRWPSACRRPPRS